MLVEAVRIFGVVVAALLVLILLLVLFSFTAQKIHAPVTAKSLNESVGYEAGSIFAGDGLYKCRKARDGSWRCEVSDQGGSGSYLYKVRVEPDSSCWQATLVSDYGETAAPKNLQSCVNVFQGGWAGVIGL